MRRGRALVVFGSFWTWLTIATVSVHSKAAGPDSRPDSLSTIGEEGTEGAPTAAAEASAAPPLHDLQQRVLAKHGPAPMFGSFIRPAPGPVALPSDEVCSPDMVAVEGEYCPFVAQKCLRWLDPEKLQCAEFERLPPASCPIKTEHKRFCMDRYEWPNAVGALPQYMASWNEAKVSCEGVGKRLCSDTEWTLACEGPSEQPYPYGDGYVRDDRACNIDKPYIWPHPEKIFNAKTQDEELARLDQREPSGARAACVSPYGVHDLVGNVDEWVVNESQGGKPFKSGLKGGYWGPVRTRCRPMTTAHDESFRYYQIGFRCCGTAHTVESGEMPLAEN